MAKPIIATNVVVQIKLHDGLTFKNEKMFENGSILIKKIGNITAGRKFTFEYVLKKMEDLIKLNIDFYDLKRFPFQVQITYTSLNGNCYERIITKYQPICYDKEMDPTNVNTGMMLQNALQ